MDATNDRRAPLLSGPIAGFDLETTGVDVETDRIVQGCVGYAETQGSWQARQWLVNPGVPIPEGASNIHGITNARVDAEGIDPKSAVALLAQSIYSLWNLGAALFGMNVVYDLTMLDRECRRHLGRPFEIGGPVVDVRVLDKVIDRYRKGKRTLTDLAKVYGVETPAAHTADGDVFATVRVGWKILRYGVKPSAQAGMQGEWVGRQPLNELTWQELHDLQVDAYYEQQMSFYDYRLRIGDPIPPAEQNVYWPLIPWEG